MEFCCPNVQRPLPQAGDQEALEKYSKRTVKVTREHNEECKRLLSLMGVPYVEVCRRVALCICVHCALQPCFTAVCTH